MNYRWKYTDSYSHNIIYFPCKLQYLMIMCRQYYKYGQYQIMLDNIWRCVSLSSNNFQIKSCILSLCKCFYFLSVYHYIYNSIFFKLNILNLMSIPYLNVFHSYFLILCLPHLLKRMILNIYIDQIILNLKQFSFLKNVCVTLKYYTFTFISLL